MNLNVLPKLYTNVPRSVDELLRRYYKMKIFWRYISETKNKGIDPLTVYYVNPNDINRLVRSDVSFSVRDAGRVANGNWDKMTLRFGEYIIHRSIEERFQDGVPWEQTPKYNECKKRIEAGGRCWRGCSTMGEISTHCRYIDKLYASINDEGYKRQTELDDTFDRNRNIYPHVLKEVSINIGRNGELILQDGRHRLSISKITGIDKIPINIVVVHSNWSGGLPNGITKECC